MNEMPKIDVDKWGADLAVKKAVIFHAQNMIIGVVEEYFKAGSYPLADGGMLPKAVLKLTQGHTIVADPQVIIELSEAEASFYADASQRMTGFITGALQFGAAKKVPETTLKVLLSTILRAHIVALENRG